MQSQWRFYRWIQIMIHPTLKKLPLVNLCGMVRDRLPKYDVFIFHFFNLLYFLVFSNIFFCILFSLSIFPVCGADKKIYLWHDKSKAKTENQSIPQPLDTEFPWKDNMNAKCFSVFCFSQILTMSKLVVNSIEGDPDETTIEWERKKK